MDYQTFSALVTYLVSAFVIAMAATIAYFFGMWHSGSMIKHRIGKARWRLLMDWFNEERPTPPQC